MSALNVKAVAVLLLRLASCGMCTRSQAWDITCVVLVMYDLTVIPYTLAWDAEVLALTIGL
eukprot:2071615-Amphidinium_carterae.1